MNFLASEYKPHVSRRSCHLSGRYRNEEELLQDTDSNRTQPLPKQQKRHATKRAQGGSINIDHTAATSATDHSSTTASNTVQLNSNQTIGSSISVPDGVGQTLINFLVGLNLEYCISALVTAECCSIADLTALSTSDYERLGVPAGPQIKISKALSKHYTENQNTSDTQTAAATTSTTHHQQPTRSGTATYSSSLDDSGGACIVCWDGEITVLALPCRHLKFCRACMIQPGTQDMPLIDSCPVCRQHVERVMEVQTRLSYLSWTYTERGNTR